MQPQLNKVCRTMYDDLMSWVAGNNKLKGQITTHDLYYLFEFNGRNGITIDLCRFSPEYYYKVFEGEHNMHHVNAFVRKVCLILKGSIAKVGEDHFDVTITVKHNTSSTTYWRTYFISSSFVGADANPLRLKH